MGNVSGRIDETGTGALYLKDQDRCRYLALAVNVSQFLSSDALSQSLSLASQYPPEIALSFACRPMRSPLLAMLLAKI